MVECKMRTEYNENDIKLFWRFMIYFGANRNSRLSRLHVLLSKIIPWKESKKVAPKFSLNNGRIIDRFQLIVIGCAYNSLEFISFIATKGSDHTGLGIFTKLGGCTSKMSVFRALLAYHYFAELKSLV